MAGERGRKFTIGGCIISRRHRTHPRFPSFFPGASATDCERNGKLEPTATRGYTGGSNYCVARPNLKITAAFERIVPNAPGAADWKQKNTNHFVLQLQFFYFRGSRPRSRPRSRGLAPTSERRRLRARPARIGLFVEPPEERPRLFAIHARVRVPALDPKLSVERAAVTSRIVSLAERTARWKLRRICRATSSVSSIRRSCGTTFMYEIALESPRSVDRLRSQDELHRDTRRGSHAGDGGIIVRSVAMRRSHASASSRPAASHEGLVDPVEAALKPPMPRSAISRTRLGAVST